MGAVAPGTRHTTVEDTPPGARPVIETTGLTRTFGALKAVDGVTLAVREREIFGLLGHNGAGKTTLIRLLNGLLTPTEGSVRVLGLDPGADGPRLRLRTGVLTESAATDELLSVRETLQTYARLCGVPPSQVDRHVGTVVGLFGLQRVEDRPGRGLSMGWRRRVALARALVHDPEVVFLDEPTANLDPLGARGVRELVAELSRDRGRTIVLCTHNLHEAQQVCDRVAILREGRLLAVGTPAELAAGSRLRPRLRVDVAARDADAARRVLVRFSPGQVEVSGATLHVRGVGRDRIPEVVGALAGAGVDIFGIVQETPSLEDVYVALHAGAGG